MKNIIIDDLHFELMIDYDQIQKRIRLIGIDINLRYEDKHPVFIGVLNGCFMFMADLMKQVHIPCEMSFVKLASYSGTDQGRISELIGVGMDLTGRHVVIVEDIVDTGLTLSWLKANLESRGAADVKILTILRKPEAAKVEVDVKYVGFDIPKDFVVGYGLDFDEKYRNLSFIGVLAKHMYE